MTQPSTNDAAQYTDDATEATRLTTAADAPNHPSLDAKRGALRDAATAQARAALSATKAGFFKAAQGHNAEGGRLSRAADAVAAEMFRPRKISRGKR